MSLALRDQFNSSKAGLYELAFRAATTPLAFAAWSGGELCVQRVNEAFARLFHLPLDQPHLRPLRQVFRGASSEQVRRAVRQCLWDGDPAKFRIAHGSTSEFTILEVEVQRVAGEGEYCAIISALEVRSPLALASLGEAGVLAEIGALSRGLVYIHDVPRGAIRCGAHPVLERLGITAGTMPAIDAMHLIEPADHKVLGQLMKKLLASADGEVVEAVCRVRDVNGDTLWANVRSQVFARTPDGQVQRILGVATDETEHYTYEAEIAAAANALAHAELNERRRIGRELHDSTSQLLVAARLGLNRLVVQERLGEEALRVLEDARQAIEDAQREIRNFSFVLHPPSLVEEGLEESLRIFVAGFARRTGIDISVEVPRGGWRLPFTTQVALFRVAQEALMNVYRHAQAENAVVRLKHKGRRIVLEVEDDGVGMPGAEGEARPEGVGISGMRARMVQVGGAFDLLAGETGVLVRASVAHELRPRHKPSPRSAAPAVRRRVVNEGYRRNEGYLGNKGFA